MDRISKIFVGITFLMAGFAYFQGGWELVALGAQKGFDTLMSVAILVIAAYMVAGLVGVLVSGATIRSYLGQEAGWRGLATAVAVGAITPGGPYVYYPIARSISNAGVGAGTVFAYLVGKTVWDLSRIPMELALLGPRITIIRWVVTFLFPPAIIYFVTCISKSLESFLPREEAKE
ncbi:MAG: hypothetical protein ACOX3A_05090 [bacterium]|jgi:uncharacterized membrane protein YraQ (UPF0718 family)